MKEAIFLAALLASAAPPQEIRFVACPIYRDVDAGKKSGCWLVDDPDNGTRYDISTAPTKPDWRHAVLVEGRIEANAPNACGGLQLNPVRVSQLRERDCPQFVLGAEGYPGHPWSLPTRNIRPLYEPRNPAFPPFATLTFTIPFDFESDYLVYQLSDFYIDKATKYALDVGRVRVFVTGFAQDSLPSLGMDGLRESPSLAEVRAKKVADWFAQSGIDRQSIHVSWKTSGEGSNDEAFDGLVSPSMRRVEVRITPY